MSQIIKHSVDNPDNTSIPVRASNTQAKKLAFMTILKEIELLQLAG
jgi:hypothetical protein